MAIHVDEKYRINIFLDTNILVDYVLGNNSNLNRSLLWFKDCEFVDLKSSHFVEYEMAEVLKAQYFYRKLKGRLPNRNEKVALKKIWKIDGKSYLNYKDDIRSEVTTSIKSVEDDLGFQFSDLRLHDGVINPTCEVCLSSKISKEDSLLLVSCMFPGEEECTDFSILLSNDKQYAYSFMESSRDIKSIFDTHSLNIPEIIHAKSLEGNSGKVINLYNKKENVEEEDLKTFLKDFILRLIIKKNVDDYVGITYRDSACKGMAAKCLYLNVKSGQFKEHDGLAFIANDLSFQRILSIPEKPNKYWNTGKEIDLPYTFDGEHRVSFLPRPNDELSENQFNKLRERGNIVFYQNE